MTLAAPHFLLYAEAAHSADSSVCDAGGWRFVLRLPSGETSLEAADQEQETSPERLELLAVIRGLEALSQPSRVTLMSGSRGIRRGLEQGLANWRENDWQWERYGRLAPVKNSDLWQRLDRLLGFHSVECRPTRLETADDFAPPPPRPQPSEAKVIRKRGGKTLRIDQPHAANNQQIANHKLQTGTNFKRKNFPSSRGEETRNRVRSFVFANLFAAWNRVLGYWRSRKRVIRS